MKKNIYYILAILVITIWSTTFVSTKILLLTLSPVEIMFYRYLIAYAALLVAYPKFQKPGSLKEELLFAAAGITGGSLYFLSENYALKFSLASNVSLLVATAPMLTAAVAHFFMKSEKIRKSLAAGFLIAFAGAFLVIFNGHFVLRLNPLGDMLAVTAAASWAVYSNLIRKIGNRYNGIFITRKVFFYSILTMLPALFATGFSWNPALFADVRILGNLLYLGLLASSLCFLLWSKVIWKIGAVGANNFIYFVPLLTMIFSALMLHEKITLIAVTGGILILSGVYISENGQKLSRRFFGFRDQTSPKEEIIQETSMKE